MSYVTAAIEVLRSEGHPLSAEQIIELIIKSRLISPTGQTPGKTLEAALYVGARDNPDFPVERLAKSGPKRAIRGSVKWALREWSQKS